MLRIFINSVKSPSRTKPLRRGLEKGNLEPKRFNKLNECLRSDLPSYTGNW